MKDARYTAIQALIRMEEAGAYSNLVLEALCTKNGLSGRDAAFAGALFYGTLERRLTLDHILCAYSAKKLQTLSPPVLGALRTGVCQLAYMDGVDDYAAVNESVNAVKQFGLARAGGYVNGVLRAFLRAGKAVPAVKGGRPAQLSVTYSCPEWLVRRWLDAYGEAAALRMLENSLGRPPLYLRANTLRTDMEGLLSALEKEGIAAHADALEGCVLAEGRVPVEKLEAFHSGLFHVQDKASQLCAAAAGAKPGERVLDVCAAPGGKSFTIAQRMQNKGELVARDLHEKRAQMVVKGAQRLGISIIRAAAGDAGIYDPSLGLFDRVLCDVPCSGFGIIRRKPEIKYKPPESVAGLPEIQYKILETSAKYVKPGGRMIYSTCTLLPAENEDIVGRFLSGGAPFGLVSEQTWLGEGCDSDGFFTAVLERRGE